ncbi:MAG: twin-arginine translocase TatA/TatE family subunit [Tepidisphaeraceae bacterium]|jgi:sec-independent protein translocase protein TatA
MILPLSNLFGPENWMVIALVALLLFGKRMPEVGRSLGKGIVEFKKGLAGIEEDITQSSQQPTIGRIDRVALPSLAAGYKFDPYTGEPVHGSDDANPDV